MATLTPAYGRDYKSAKDCENDFRAGKDFIFQSVKPVLGGRYCSIRDFKTGESVTLRYRRKESVIIVKV